MEVIWASFLYKLDGGRTLMTPCGTEARAGLQSNPAACHLLAAWPGTSHPPPLQHLPSLTADGHNTNTIGPLWGWGQSEENTRRAAGGRCTGAGIATVGGQLRFVPTLLFLKSDLIFSVHLRFTEKLSRKYRESPCTSCPHNESLPLLSKCSFTEILFPKFTHTHTHTEQKETLKSSEIPGCAEGETEAQRGRFHTQGHGA